MRFGVTLPFASVARYNGKYYLTNGFHRAIGLRQAGATHMPCMVRDVATPEDVGIQPPGTFQLPLLESPDPPTVGHFTQGRAHNVTIRQFARFLHVSWAEYAIPEE
jgi:hypothetical protein